ncbi:MAG: phosphoribosylanthranilate isomerase [Flavipsychrobacter sp.]|nr:phosphoribosylanthranilate isomerase [Flavipsychrobacter sp.]
MLVKICGLRNSENIEAVARLQPDFIGLIFYRESKRYIHSDPILEDYTRKLTSVKKVGVFVNPTYDEVMLAVADHDLDFIQLHGNETITFCDGVNKVIPVIKAFHIGEIFEWQTLETYIESTTLFLFDTYTKEYGGSGKKFNWDILSSYHCSHPFFLSGGIASTDIESIKKIAHPNLIGIDVNSSIEDSPGIKNIDKVKKLINEVRNR